MNSQTLIAMSRDFFEAFLTPSDTCFLSLIALLGIGAFIFGWRNFDWRLPLDSSPFDTDSRENITIGCFFWSLFIRILLTGPVMAVVGVGLSALYFQGKYDAAQRSFQERLKQQEERVQPMFDRLEEKIAAQDDRDVWHIEQYRVVKAQLIFNEVMQKSHPQGCLVVNDAVLFQLIDGYTDSGQIIWSETVIALQARSEGLVKHEFDLSAMYGRLDKTKAFELRQLKDKLFMGDKRVSRFTTMYGLPIVAMKASIEDSTRQLKVCYTIERFKDGGVKEIDVLVGFPPGVPNASSPK